MPNQVSFIQDDPEWLALERQRRLAEALAAQQQPMPNPAQMAGGFVVPVSPLEGLARVAGNVANRVQVGRIDERQKALADRIREEGQRDTQSFVQALQGRPEEQLPPDVFGPPQPGQAPDRNRAMAIALGSRNPMVQNAGSSMLAQMLRGDEPVVVGRTLMTRSGKPVGVDSTWQQEQQASRQAKEQELQLRFEEQRRAREEQAALRRELAGQASADRRFLAQMADSRKEQKNVPKLPTPALKLQQEELDAIGTASSIQADLKALEGQIDAGKLKLGPVSNIASQARNMAGMSDEQSRNFQSFQSTLEKLRNDSLRLNKGVQTEGDAQRAWNELIKNINDPKVVKQRLGEIQKINARAANLRKMNIDSIRSNYGMEPMDTSGYEKQAPAVGGGASGGWSIQRVE